MTLLTVEITGTFADGSGEPLNGTVTFTPTATVYAAGVPVLQPDVPVAAQITAGQLLAPSGAPLMLVATDNGGLQVEGLTGWWAWNIQATISGQVQDQWSFFLPWSADPVDLASLANTPAGGGGGGSGGVQIGGDLGGTDDNPEVISLHLGSPVPVAQGGTGATSASGARTNLGLGTAAVQSSGAFDAAGLAAAAQAASVPLSGADMGGPLAPKVVTLTQSGGSVVVNAATGNAFNLALTASGWAVTAPSNPADGQVIRFRLQQDATGSRTVTWASGSGGYDFGTTGTPTLSTAANTVDVIGFEYCALNSRWNCAGSALGF